MLRKEGFRQPCLFQLPIREFQLRRSRAARPRSAHSPHPAPLLPRESRRQRQRSPGARSERSSDHRWPGCARLSNPYLRLIQTGGARRRPFGVETCPATVLERMDQPAAKDVVHPAELAGRTDLIPRVRCGVDRGVLARPVAIANECRNSALQSFAWGYGGLMYS